MGPPPAHGPPRRRGRVLAVVALAVTLIATGVVVVVLLNRDDDGDTDPAADARQWVEGYLAALEDGDAAAALDYLDTSAVEDRSLLTDAVLARSAELGGQVSDADVTIDDRLSTARVELLVGEQPRTLELTIDRAGDDWVIRTGVLTYRDAARRGLPLTVNGVEPADAADLTVFPGVYEIDAGPHLTWGESPLTLGLEDETLDLTLSATAEGESAARQAVQQALRECTRSQDLQPTGCPFQGPLGIPGLRPSSVRWSLPGPVRWVPVLDRASLVGDLQLTVRLQASGTDGTGGVLPYDESSALTVEATVDLTTETLVPSFS